MDRFSRLPTLVLTNILGQLHADRDLFNLIRASPESLEVYIRYRNTFARQRLPRFLDLDADGTIVQDALAIINFPRIGEHSPISLPTISVWLDTLKARNFEYRQDTANLYCLFTQLVVFIEDYLAKSLDPFPARACMTLPTIGLLAPCMQLRGQEIDINPVSFDNMVIRAQRRLLQAFVRYELRCKIYDPRVWVHLQGTRYGDMVDRLNDRLTPSDCEELHCVFEYVRGMYGAVFAQSNYDTWFPDRPDPNTRVAKRPKNGEYLKLPSAKELGLLFPDDLYFDGAILSHQREFDILPCLGLDLLSSIIQDPRFDGKTLANVDVVFQHSTWGFCGKGWIMRDPFTHNDRPDISQSRFRRWQWDIPILGPHWRLFYRGEVEQKMQKLKLQMLQSKIYRQRGWISFRDSPGHRPTLPTMEYIVKEHDSVSGWICLEQEKKRRRSQKWQYYWAARSWEDPLDPNSPANQSNPVNRRSRPRVYVSSTIPRFFLGGAV